MVLKRLANMVKAALPDKWLGAEPVSYGLAPGMVRCDLHAHPHISCEDDLIDVMEAMVANDVGLVAITTQGKGSDKELTYPEVKHMIGYEHAGEEFRYVDCGETFFVTYRKKRLVLCGACSTNVSVDAVGGLVQLVALMPCDGLYGLVEDGMAILDYLALAKQHDAVVIASQPYVLAEETARGKLLFRIADDDERRYIRTRVLPLVDCVELVRAHSRLSDLADALVLKDFNRRPILSSGVHASSSRSRRKIGSSGTAFMAETWYWPREQIRGMIGNDEFQTYTARDSIMPKVVSSAVEKAKAAVSRKAE
jgi:hypothetical protein